MQTNCKNNNYKHSTGDKPIGMHEGWPSRNATEVSAEFPKE